MHDVCGDCRGQALSRWLIVGARHGFEVFDCRVSLRPASTLVLAVECSASATAVDVDFEDRRVVDEAIDDGERHGGIGEHLAPGAKRLVSGDQGRASFVARADQLEQHRGFCLVLADVGEVEDQQIEAVEPIYGRLERQFAACDLEPLHQVGCAGEHHA